MPEDTTTAAPAAKPKRRYTVSAKVLAANRRNLEKANAVPKEIRYRLTPKRVAACRQNRLKARAARPPAGGPVRRTVHHAFRRSRQKLAGLEDCLRKVNRVLNPDWRRSAIVAQAIGEMVWQCLTLLRNHCQQERRALIECWQEAWPRSRPPVAADLAGRLLTLFARRERLPRECKYLTERLLHWGHFYFEMNRRPSSQPRQAMGRPTAPEVGNPFRPFNPFHRPFHPDRQGTAPDEKPPDESTTEESSSGSPLQGAASDEAEEPPEGPAERPKTSQEREAAQAEGEPQRLEFEDYRKQVEQAIGAPPALDPLVHEIVRLSWERHELIAQWVEQAEAQLEKLLRRTPRGWPADDFVAKLVEALGGQAIEQVGAEAPKLETRLKTAFYKYLRQRYGKHPVFRPFKPVHISAAKHRKAMKKVEALLRARRAAAERNVPVSAAGTSASQAPEPAIQPASSQGEINSSKPSSQTTPDPQQFNHPIRGLEDEPGPEWHRRPAGTENEASETSAQQAERENRNRAGTEWHRRPSDMAAAVGPSPAAGASGH